MTLVLPHPRTILLRSPAVHDELQLTPGQVLLVDDMLEGIEHRLWQLRDVDLNLRNTLAQPLLQQLDDSLTDILSATQGTRFEELIRQSYGLNGILLTPVTQGLKMTGTQVA
ncbi:hypothetical protein ACFL6U_16510 [Planctomycetota bacterium]